MAPRNSLLPRTGLAPLLASLDLPGEIQLPDGVLHSTGTGRPIYRVVFQSETALQTPMTELSISEAFIKGDIDIEGDIEALFGARKQLQDKMPLRQKIRFLYDFARTATKMNAKAVGEHYNYGDDLYLSFIDKRFRFYSHGHFQSPDDSIEDASEHKLDTMFRGLGLNKGMRLLDIGGGWGGVTQYCSARGVHVTTLTLTRGSKDFIDQLIEERNLPGEVSVEDFLTYNPVEPYDHAVIFGVIEHIPNYRRFARKVWQVLKSGGKLYLDGSAAVEKFAVSSFTREYIWRGTHTYMTVQDVMAEMLYHGFEIVEVVRETRDYELTMLEWAKRLDAAKEDVIGKWGEKTYRMFRLFLWGGMHAFKTNSLQAYHMIAERTPTPGPRPSIPRRITQFMGNLQ
ncbi:S-adenosyl-L-methionine-dependent methyltransferase [Phaeosphaeria sp. MPI-PUGE-AT-0046c]|nr:S-adenosyl-L-methionine-dependent methyltransferase [Phaeosphaeria sp. MPI-PUGE-AT-0046c]